MRAVIFDIDGTLADASHRIHHVTGGNRDWAAFFSAMADDPIVGPIRDLLYLVYDADIAIVLCSGRPENYRAVTEAWLERYEVSYAALYMRPEGDHRADYIVKAQLLAGMREDGYEPWLAVDDRPSVVAMWRENGIICLQCRDWDERPATTPGLLTIMVGPSGAGKSTWLTGPEATTMGIKARHIISSDQIREDLCGDFRSQERNDDVFAALHAQVKTRLSHGLPAVVDATNLRDKDRVTVASLAPAGGAVRYIVLDRPMEQKIRDAGWRAEVKDRDDKPFDLIGKHAQIFASNLKNILSGDGLPNVTVMDLRQ